MSIKIDANSKKVILRIRSLKRLTKSGVEHGAFTSGRGLVKAASAAILKKPKGGKVYISKTIGGRRRRHKASKAGETHANMSGTLRKSLSFKVNPRRLEFGYGVTKGDAPEYAGWVENGTKNMDARPSLLNSIKSERRNFQNNFLREIGKRLEGRGF